MQIKKVVKSTTGLIVAFDLTAFTSNCKRPQLPETGLSLGLEQKDFIDMAIVPTKRLVEIKVR